MSIHVLSSILLRRISRSAFGTRREVQSLEPKITRTVRQLIVSRPPERRKISSSDAAGSAFEHAQRSGLRHTSTKSINYNWLR